jgi:hypothetical protein
VGFTGELSAVRERYSQAQLREADGQRALLVTGVPLPSGWNLSETAIAFLIPVGFPHAAPDCFFADADLRLASGAEPANSAMQPLLGSQYRWFSWHPVGWRPESGSLASYLRFCEARLREVR